jgi:exodeoxyribonuclease V gamma subunit
VSQLRDYLAAGWGESVLAPRCTEHPLQPFSRRYFELTASEAGTPLFTHAREWRVAHAEAAAQADAGAAPTLADACLAEPGPGALPPLTLDMLAGFLKNPVRDFFRRRLLVVFGDGVPADDDDEAFGLDGLAAYGLLQELIDDGLAALQGDAATVQPAAGAARVSAQIACQVARIQRAGRLPMAEPGRRAAQDLLQTGVQMFRRWTTLQALYPLAAPREPLRCGVDGLQLDDWLAGLRLPPDGQGLPVWFELSASRLCQKSGADPEKLTVQPDKLIAAWVRSVAASACGVPARGVIVGPDASVTVEPPAGADAVAALQTLVQAWGAGMAEPLPLAARTGLASAAGAADPALVYEGSSFGAGRGERDEPCLARQFPDFEALAADGRFALLAEALYGPMLVWIDQQVSVTPHAAVDLADLADLADQAPAAAERA